MKRPSLPSLQTVVITVLIVLFSLGIIKWLENNTTFFSTPNSIKQENLLVHFPTADYTTSWDEQTKTFTIFFQGKTLQTFEVPRKPLAAWLKPDSGTVVLAASEDGTFAANQVLYIRKDSSLRELSHLVSGYEKNTAYTRSFYDRKNASVNTLDDIYITPNEELVIAREYGKLGFSPRVFFTDLASLTGYRNTFDHQNVYWSPNGKCYLYWGEESEDSFSFGNEFGYFQTSTDFVSYDVLDNTHDRRDVQVVWENQERCSGYVTMIADEEGHLGAPSYDDKKYTYHFGVAARDMLQEVSGLPKNSGSFLPSMKSNQKLIMVTY